MNQNMHIIGLSGKAGSGKTSVAEYIVPKGSFYAAKYGVIWDHIFFALPIYEMATSKKNIKGNNEVSRKKYAIHETLFDLYGRSPIGDIPQYDSLVEKVNKIFNLPIEDEGVKPRSFLQSAGDICRDGSPNCFSTWAIKKCHTLHRNYLMSLEKEEEERNFYVIVSDVRYENEAEAILSSPNGKLIFFDANKDTLDKRLLKRDGRTNSIDQSNHSSEQQSEIMKSMANFVISTDNMSIEEQVDSTLLSLSISTKETLNA